MWTTSHPCIHRFLRTTVYLAESSHLVNAQQTVYNNVRLYSYPVVCSPRQRANGLQERYSALQSRRYHAQPLCKSFYVVFPASGLLIRRRSVWRTAPPPPEGRRRPNVAIYSGVYVKKTPENPSSTHFAGQSEPFQSFPYRYVGIHKVNISRPACFYQSQYFRHQIRGGWGVFIFATDHQLNESQAIPKQKK